MIAHFTVSGRTARELKTSAAAVAREFWEAAPGESPLTVVVEARQDSPGVWRAECVTGSQGDLLHGNYL